MACPCDVPVWGVLCGQGNPRHRDVWVCLIFSEWRKDHVLLYYLWASMPQKRNRAVAASDLAWKLQFQSKTVEKQESQGQILLLVTSYVLDSFLHLPLPHLQSESIFCIRLDVIKLCKKIVSHFRQV